MMQRTYRTASGKSIDELLTQFGQRALRHLGTQLYREATGVVEASKPLVPVDTGTLRASSYVAEPKIVGDRVSVEFGYGGPAAKINPKSGESVDSYALRVHENLEAFHKVGTAKFLELPLMQALPGMTQRIAANMKNDIDREAMG